MCYDTGLSKAPCVLWDILAQLIATMWTTTHNVAKLYVWLNTRPMVALLISQDLKNVVLSTTVSELYAFTNCVGTFNLLRELWMVISPARVAIHMRTDANSLAATT